MNPPGKEAAYIKDSKDDGAEGSVKSESHIGDNSKSRQKTKIETEIANIKNATIKDDSVKDQKIKNSKTEKIDILEQAGDEYAETEVNGFENNNILDPEMERAIDVFKDSFKTDETAIPFFLFLVRGVCKHRKRIDKIINETSENWKLDRMGVVDRNILRFAIFELMFADDIPSSVSMNEAIEIAKRYGTADSPSFINGILDKIASVEKKREKTDSKE